MTFSPARPVRAGAGTLDAHRSPEGHALTAYPIAENSLCWWLTTFKGWRHLHAVRGGALTAEDHRAAVDWGEPVTRTTVCGRELALTYAGIGSRFSMPRCAHCCRKLGIPPGPGTPVNEAAGRRLREEAANA